MKFIWFSLLLTSLSLAHEHSTPWIDSGNLEQGLYISVSPPWAVRNNGDFPVSIQIRNIDSTHDVYVEAIRLLGKTTQQIEPRKMLHSQGDLLQQVQTAKMLFENGGNDKNQKEFVGLLAKLGHVTCVARWMVPSKADTVTIEIDILENGKPRTIQKSVRVNKQPPLPRGGIADVAIAVDKTCIQTIVSPRNTSTRYWFAGDQHIHTSFSVDAVILDGTEQEPYEYSQYAESIGLDWAIFTDHSNITYSEIWGDRDWYVESQFNQGQSECQQYRTDHDWLSIYSQEMGLGQQGFWDLASHMLCLPLDHDLADMLPNPSSGMVYGHANCESEQTIINRINDAGAFGFIAHPYEWEYLFFHEWNWGNGTNGWAGMELMCDSGGSYDEDDWSTWYKWHELLNGIATPTNGQLQERESWPNRFPVGIGNSDAHEPGNVGQVWTYVAMENVTRSNLKEGILGGHCIASNGPLGWVSVNNAFTGEVAVLPNGMNTNVVVSIRTNESMGYAGEYGAEVLVNGEVRRTIEPSGLPYYSLDIYVNDLNLGPGDKFVTLRVSKGGLVCLPNPVWLQHTIFGDIDASGSIDLGDLLSIIGNWGPCSGCLGDLNQDGVIDTQDLLELIAIWV
jgi:hypothetical protein